jgi:hypothetical protein
MHIYLPPSRGLYHLQMKPHPSNNLSTSSTLIN